jgi:hypothetical protein
MLTKQTRITIDNINVTKINNMTTTEVRIEIEGTKLKVSGYYSPAEEAVMYTSNMDGYPGSPSEFDIQDVCANDSEINIVDLLNYDVLIKIEELVLIELEN